MRRVEFEIPGECPPQGSIRAFQYRAKGRKGKWGVNQVYQNQKEITKFRKIVKDAIKSLHDDFFVNDIDLGYIVEVVTYTTKPKSVDRPFPTVKGSGDIDKLIRALLDALTYNSRKNPSGLYKDDAQVVRVIGTKLYTDHENPEPKTKVRITKILLSNAESELKKFTEGVLDEFEGKN
jgi:Holliday junction resolvase RusA-like endonuclease